MSEQGNMPDSSQDEGGGEEGQQGDGSDTLEEPVVTPTPVYIKQGEPITAGALMDPDGPPWGIVNLYDTYTREIGATWAGGVVQHRSLAQWPADRDGFLSRVEAGTMRAPHLCLFDHESWNNPLGNRYIHTSTGATERGSIPSGKYWTYDFGVSEEPVNAVPNLREMKPHVARFAHELDAYHGHRSHLAAERQAQQVIEKMAWGWVGEAWLRLRLLEAIDPQQLTLDGTELLWKKSLYWPELIIGAMCDMCDTEMWARRILRNIDVSAFQAQLDTGKVPAIDRTTTPWTPSTTILADVGRDNPDNDTLETFYRRMETGYHRALDYYDSEVDERRSYTALATGSL